MWIISEPGVLRWGTDKPVSASAAHTSASHRRGFTLIEILVVLFIIGLISGIALLSLGVIGGDRGLAAETEVLANRIKLLSERAGLEGNDYGIYLEPSGYEVMRLNNRSGVWERVTNDSLLKAHPIDPTIQMRLTIEGRPVSLAQMPANDLKRVPTVNQSLQPMTDANSVNARVPTGNANTSESSKVVDDSEGRDERFNKAFDRDHLKQRWLNRPPHIVVTASGELTPFEWHISRLNSSHAMQVTGDAQLAINITTVPVAP